MWTTTRGVYLCQVLNTAILMLLLKSNLGGEKLGCSNERFRGR